MLSSEQRVGDQVISQDLDASVAVCETPGLEKHFQGAERSCRHEATRRKKGIVLGVIYFGAAVTPHAEP
jgi:hypothetical protein